MTRSLKNLSPGDRLFGVDKKHLLISEVEWIEHGTESNPEKDIVHLKLFSVGTQFCVTRGYIRSLFRNKVAKLVNSLEQELEERRLERIHKDDKSQSYEDMIN